MKPVIASLALGALAVAFAPAARADSALLDCSRGGGLFDFVSVVDEGDTLLVRAKHRDLRAMAVKLSGLDQEAATSLVGYLEARIPDVCYRSPRDPAVFGCWPDRVELVFKGDQELRIPVDTFGVSVGVVRRTTVNGDTRETQVRLWARVSEVTGPSRESDMVISYLDQVEGDAGARLCRIQ